jgi:hypothetical protein
MVAQRLWAWFRETFYVSENQPESLSLARTPTH